MVGTVTPCSYPIGVSGDPCRRKSVAVYVVGRELYYRCRLHDGPKVRATADEKGIERRELAAAA